jgi:hypothetical protein
MRRRRWLNRRAAYADDGPGVVMGSFALTQLISLVLAVAAIGATGGFVASAVARRKKRRARGVFFLGFFCGLMAGSILLARRRGRNALGAVARGVDLRTLRASTGVGPASVVSTFTRLRLRHHAFDQYCRRCWCAGRFKPTGAARGPAERRTIGRNYPVADHSG